MSRIVLVIAFSLIAGCSAQSPDRVRLKARPGKPQSGSCEPGTNLLKLRANRDAVLYVPKSVSADKPAPLVVYFHGAGGSSDQGVRRMGRYADEFGFLLLSPASEQSTWDAIADSYGADVRETDRALERVFASCAIDRGLVAAAGFSDGASYALGLGISNGELFRTIVAFSPGFIPQGTSPNGKPRIFISHGTNDQILPIDRCSRQLVPQLRRADFVVEYHEFDGPHTVPPEIGSEAFRSFLK